MNLTEEQTEQARQLVQSGATRLKLEQELGLNENDAYKLSIRLGMDNALARRPELLDDVRFLLEEGESKFQIKKALGLPVEAVDYLISKARGVIVDDELKLEEEPALAKAAARKSNEQGKADALKKVTRLLDEGYGPLRIQKELGLTREVVDSLSEEVRAAQFLKPHFYSKQDKVDTVTRVKDEGGDAFQLARVVGVSPAAAQKIIKNAEGRTSIADENLRAVASKGTTLFTLQNRFGFRTREQVMEALAENFPDCFIYEKLKDDGDTGLTLIPDRDNVWEFLKQPGEPRQFRRSVSLDNNYMVVQMLPEFTGDYMRIYNLTDVHVGHTHFRQDIFEKHVNMIADDPNAFCVFGGDMFEWMHKNSVGSLEEQNLSPMQQVPASGALLAKIKHKALAYRCGNHDKGRGRLTGTDLAEVLSSGLDVPYFKTEVIIQIDFTPARLFTVLLDHGHSGSAVQSILRDAGKFMEFSSYPVHAHFSGHVHNSTHKALIYKVPNMQTMKIEFGRTHIIVGGSYLGYTGTYAEESKYAPTPQDLGYFQMNRDGTYKQGFIEIDPI